MNSSIHRALVFQGGGSLGAYEAGAYKDINEELSLYLKAEVRENEPIFHIVSGTSIGAINAAILVSYVKVTRKQGRYEDLLKGKIDVGFVARLERKNDSHTISNKIFDFTKNTILQLIQDGYEETKDQLKKVFEAKELE
jgi:predicted acylesterase/phospholipase RssA